MIDFRDISKVYRTGGVVFEALKGTFIKIERGEFVSLMGPPSSLEGSSNG